jgi:putative peptidoglycan lipid II flippase
VGCNKRIGRQFVKIERNKIILQPFNISWTYSGTIMLWVFYFCFSVCAALLFQKMILPLLPSLHAGHGLLVDDATLFHNRALLLAEQIKQVGWGAWTLNPISTASGTGNVAVLAILYVLFDPDPSLLIPVNAALHATGGILIFLIGRLLWPGRIGKYGGLLASILFITFPSALNWYGQVHKDGYAIAGYLIVLFSWIKWISARQTSRGLTLFLLGIMVGGLLIGFVRPYALQLLTVVSIAMYLSLCVFFGTRSSNIRRKLRVSWLGIVPILFLAMIIKAPNTVEAITGKITNPAASGSNKIEWKWDNSDWVPDTLEIYPHRLSAMRALFLGEHVYDAKSTIDRDVTPSDMKEMFLYFPRAMQIILYAPFPNSWFDELSPTRAIGILETLIWYIASLGIVVVLYYNRSPALVLILTFSLSFLLIYGYVLPNVGTLHRVRYPFLSLLILVGVSGLVRLVYPWIRMRPRISNISRFHVNRPKKISKPSVSMDAVPNGRSLAPVQVVWRSSLVLIMTGLSFLLLFFRDVMMSRWYGLGTELDAFYVAMVIPMFFVNVLSVPMGLAFVPIYLETVKQKGIDSAQILVSAISSLSIRTLGVLVVVLLLIGPWFLGQVGRGLSEAQLDLSWKIFPFGVAILFLSGNVVLGNSVLNAHHRFFVPIVSQAIVPIMAILCLLILSDSFGIQAVAFGLVLGQAINLILVYLFSRKHEISILPQSVKIAPKELVPMLTLFGGLILSTLFISAAMLIDTMMASMLSEGSVGAYSLGIKVVLFVTGVIGSGISVVILPHFSLLAIQNKLGRGHGELTQFLILTNLLTIPFALIFFEFSEFFIRAIFQGGAMTDESVGILVKVAVYGMFQLPFFTSSILLIRFFNAQKKVRAVLLAAIIGLIANVILNYILMRSMGVAGLALATTLSLFLSTIIILLGAWISGAIVAIEFAVFTMLWVLYLTGVLSVVSQSSAGLVVSLIASVILLAHVLEIRFWTRRA